MRKSWGTTISVFITMTYGIICPGSSLDFDICANSQLKIINADPGIPIEIINLTGMVNFSIEQNQKEISGISEFSEFINNTNKRLINGQVSFYILINDSREDGLPSYDNTYRSILFIDGVEGKIILGQLSQTQMPGYFPNLNMYCYGQSDDLVYSIYISLVLKPKQDQVKQLFRRGEINNDGVIDLSDPITLLNVLFSGESSNSYCTKAMDVNDDGIISIDDAIYSLKRLFVAGPEIPMPGKPCGIDPTEDDLECGISAYCTTLE